MKQPFSWTILKLTFLVIQITFSPNSYSQQILGVDSMPILGAGIKFNLVRPSLKTCLADSKNIFIKQEINTEIYYLESKKNHKFEDYETEAFVKKNLKLLKEKKRSLKRKKVSSFLIIIDIDKNIGFKSLDKLSFQKDIEQTLDDKNYDLFFQECGDHFIESVKKRSRLLLFTSFYGARLKDRWILKKTIKKRVTYDPKDSFQLGLFKDFEYNSFFHLNAIQKGVGEYSDLLYGVDKWRGKGLDYYIKAILKKSLNTQDGYLISFQKRKWSDLPALLKLHNENGEQKHSTALQLKSRKFLQRLQNDLFLFKSKKVIAQKTGNKLCYSKVLELEKILNWKTLSDCKKNLLSYPLGNSNRIKECFDMKVQFRSFFKERSCQKLRAKSPLLSPFIYQERKIDIKNPDPKIKIGLGVDPQGAKYKNCLKNVDLPYIQKANNENYAKNIYSPQKKGLFFARINSSLTLLETSKRALSRFKLPKDLVDKMNIGLPQFFKECGTHFISSIKFKKGYDLNLKISNFRAFRKRVFLDDENDLPNLNPSLEVFRGFKFKKKKKKKRAKWLKKVKVSFSPLGFTYKSSPKNLEEFLRKYPKIKNAIDKEPKGIPTSITLTPWSDIFLWNNLLTQEELDFFDSL